MRIYGDCPGFFRDSLVVGSVCQNDHRNFQHHTLTAAFNVFIATARRRDGPHMSQATTIVLESWFYILVVVAFESSLLDVSRSALN
jgi:hypothetical protein